MKKSRRNPKSRKALIWGAVCTVGSFGLAISSPVLEARDFALLLFLLGIGLLVYGWFSR